MKRLLGWVVEEIGELATTAIFISIILLGALFLACSLYGPGSFG